MKTIIQALPTIYGEASNGSVYGQPNGSIARPPQSIPGFITLTADSATLTFIQEVSGNGVYQVSGLTCIVNVASYYDLILTIKDSSDNLVAAVTNSYLAGADFNKVALGQIANKPTNGDSLTAVVSARDSDGQTVIVSSSAVTITAVIA